MSSLISFNKIGEFTKTLKFLKGANLNKIENILDKYGKAGVRALASNTPKDTGTTANSWHYKITQTSDKAYINWYNTNIVDGVTIAIIIQYGHSNGRGGYVEGNDYINPAMKPIFDELANKAWKEVIKE